MRGLPAAPALHKKTRVGARRRREAVQGTLSAFQKWVGGAHGTFCHGAPRNFLATPSRPDAAEGKTHPGKRQGVSERVISHQPNPHDTQDTRNPGRTKTQGWRVRFIEREGCHQLAAAPGGCPRPFSFLFRRPLPWHSRRPPRATTIQQQPRPCLDYVGGMLVEREGRGLPTAWRCGQQGQGHNGGVARIQQERQPQRCRPWRQGLA